MEFGHADHTDKFILVGNLLFALFRNWGVAMFFLCVGVVPAGLLIYFLRQPITLIWSGEWVAGIWVGLSFPLSIWMTWIRWQRLKLNRFVVDAHGIEHLWYPRRPRRIAWSELQKVRDTWIPEVDESPTELVFEPVRGRKLTLDAEDWPNHGIKLAVARHFPISYDKDAHAAAKKR
jgi:hypothetical protein